MLLLAHAIETRADLPIPEWLFGWAAALVLVVSFVALASLWPAPRLEGDRWRPLPVVGRVLASRPLEILCGAIGVFLFGVVVYAGLQGEQTPDANIAPRFVYIIFWVGFVVASVLLGDVYRAFNPWRALGRSVAWVAKTAARTDLPAPLTYPERLGRWPAAAGIFAFAVLELVYEDGDLPEKVAAAALVYSAVTFVAMALYGVEVWTNRGEAFSVYFNLFSRISVFERQGDQVGVRPLLGGLPKLDPLPGTVALLTVMIGTVTFDGFSESRLWTDFAKHLIDFFDSLGFSARSAFEASSLVGVLLCLLAIGGFYRLGIKGVRSVSAEIDEPTLARAFVHTLVPIALAYVLAHYLTLLLEEGQAVAFLASDPLGRGSDLFGTADSAINYFMTSSSAWYTQVALVVAGHVAGLTLAHDRALALYREAKAAVRSQYWMLVVMVGFTSLALFLLAQANG